MIGQTVILKNLARNHRLDGEPVVVVAYDAYMGLYEVVPKHPKQHLEVRNLWVRPNQIVTEGSPRDQCTTHEHRPDVPAPA